MGRKNLPSGSQARVLRALERSGVTVLPAKRGKGSHRLVTYKGAPSTVQSGQWTPKMIETVLKQLNLDEDLFLSNW